MASSSARMKRLGGKVAQFYLDQVKGRGNKREADMRLMALMLPRGSNRWVSRNTYQKGSCCLKLKQEICLVVKNICSEVIFSGFKYHLCHFLMEILIVPPYLPEPEFTLL